MAEVILIYPVTGLDIKGVSIWLPLSVMNVASTLVDEYDVSIIDQRTDVDWANTLASKITDVTICVGISSMTGTQIKHGIKAAKHIRQIHPDLPIVWGGVHPTLAPETTILSDYADIVVMGEGEITFRKLVGLLKDKKSYRELKNVCYLDTDGRVVKNGTGTEPVDFLDRNALPDLPYHLIDVEYYISTNSVLGMNVRSLPYISSFGCPYECAFCCQPVLSKRRWRCQKPELVIERVNRLKERHDLDAIEFHDEEFFTDRKRGRQIAELIDGNFKWYVQTRMDDLLHMDLDHLQAKGLRAVQPGIETGSEKILSLINKKETLDDFIKANKQLAKTDIVATYNFMIGFPDETMPDIEDSVNLAIKLLDDNKNACLAGFYVYVPYPGAKLYERAVDEGFVPPRTLEGWAKFNRQHLETPWVRQAKDVYEMLMFTSKFVDGKRLSNSFSDFPYNRIIKFLSKRYRAKWQKRDLRSSADVKYPLKLAKVKLGW